jgi:hypothetical protein
MIILVTTGTLPGGLFYQKRSTKNYSHRTVIYSELVE